LYFADIYVEYYLCLMEMIWPVASSFGKTRSFVLCMMVDGVFCMVLILNM